MDTATKKKNSWGILLIPITITSFIVFVFTPIMYSGVPSAKAKARAAIKTLSDAIDGYHKDHQSLPLSKGQSEDTERNTDVGLMNTLCGMPANISYFEFKAAKGKDGAYFDGLHRPKINSYSLRPMEE